MSFVPSHSMVSILHAELLRKIVERRYRCTAEVRGAIPVQTRAPDGEHHEHLVYSFDLTNFEEAPVAYAWSRPSETGFVTILGVPPVHTAADAVRSVVQAEREAGDDQKPG
ncbi:MAG: hypothetical protein IPK07_29845 [Deltaproteobacteria bacterium]|nr:hypothetical protein [Deltaproteobacteria bacterium]